MATIYYGKKKTVGDVFITWHQNNDIMIISVGNTDIPITFEFEDNPFGGYGGATSREIFEMDATDEYTACIGNKKFSGINKKTIEAICIDNYQETDGTISFKLSLTGSKVILPGNWHYVIGTVKIKNGNITVEE